MGTHGLTLGKFAPLHRGHQLLIETAIRECDRVTVLIYHAPETTRVPLGVRSGWLRALYPSVEVIEAWDGPTSVGYSRELKRRHEQYVLSIGLPPVTHFYSSELYGEHMSAALGAVDRRVDEGREQVPISGTRVRQDPYAHKELLDPRVYRDLILNVAFLGAPGTGKTTLASALARELETAWMPELGRAYWHEHQVDRRLSPDQLVTLARLHLEEEDRKLLEANRVLFTDTHALTTWTFARRYHGCVPDRLTDIVRAALPRYDLVFLCQDDFECEATWDRSGPGRRRAFQRQVESDLRQWKVPFFPLSGSVRERIARVRSILDRFEKYDNVAEIAMN